MRGGEPDGWAIAHLAFQSGAASETLFLNLLAEIVGGIARSAVALSWKRLFGRSARCCRRRARFNGGHGHARIELVLPCSVSTVMVWLKRPILISRERVISRTGPTSP